MIFLDYSADLGRADLKPEAMNVPAVKALYQCDKTKNKEYFWMYITYLFFVYRSGGIYDNLFISVRKRTTCVHQLKKAEDFWQTIEDRQEMKDLIEWYLENSKSKEEQLLDALDNDIEQYLDFLKKIPYTRQVRVETSIGEGKEPIVGYRSEDNSDDKMRAIRNSKELVLYRKELKKLVKENGVKKKAGKSFRTRQFET